MQTNPASRLWARALAALRVGARAAARTPLARLAAASNSRVDYWLALAHAAESPLTAVDCLDRVLAIDPHNEVALAGLEWNRWLLTRSSLPAPHQDGPEPTPKAASEPSGQFPDSHPMSFDRAEPAEEPLEERASSVLQKIDELEAALENDLTPSRSVFVDPPEPAPRPYFDRHVSEPTQPTLPEPVDTSPVELTSAQPDETPAEPDVADLPPTISETIGHDLTPVATESVEAAPALPLEAQTPIEPVASLDDHTFVDVSSEAPALSTAQSVTSAIPDASVLVTAIIPVEIVPEETATPTVALPADASLQLVAAESSPTPESASLDKELVVPALLAEQDVATPAEASALPSITEQELATAEWQRWVNGATPPPLPAPTANPEAARIVNEVSERLALALQRVLKQRGPAESPTADEVAESPRTLEMPPVITVAPRLDERLTTTTLQTSDISSARPAANGPKILIVDDSATIRRVVVDGLTAHGYQVCEAADGVEGIREIATQRPDLILLDITMPRLDGYRLCRLVKGHASTRHIPVVMLSGKDGTFDKLRGRLAGSSDYITKPFDTPSLLRKVEHCLNSRSRKDASTTSS